MTSPGNLLVFCSLEARDGVSRLGLVSRLASRLVFAILRLEGYRSRDFEYYKEMV